MGDSEGNLDFMLFLDNYVPEIKRTSVKRHIRNIVNEICQKIL